MNPLQSSNKLKKSEKLITNNESPLKTTFGKSNTKKITISNKNKEYGINISEKEGELHIQMKKPSKNGTLN